MPLIELIAFCKRTAQQNRALMDTAREALCQGFETDLHAMSITLTEHDQNTGIPPQGKTERYLIVKVSCFPNRSREQKARFYRLLCEGIARCGEDCRQCLILLNEPPLCNWGIMGGQSADTLFPPTGEKSSQSTNKSGVKT